MIYIKLSDYDTIGSTVTTTTATKTVTINGKDIISAGDKIIKVTIGNGTNQSVNAVFKDKFYDKIKKYTFNEYIGEYQNNTQANTEDKITYRVITYIDTQCL